MGLSSVCCCAVGWDSSPICTISAELQNTIFVNPAPSGGLQNTIFVDPAAPGTLQNIIFVDPARPGSVLGTLWASRGRSGTSLERNRRLENVSGTLRDGLGRLSGTLWEALGRLQGALVRLQNIISVDPPAPRISRDPPEHYCRQSNGP